MSGAETDFLILAGTLLVGLILAAFGGQLLGWWEE